MSTPFDRSIIALRASVAGLRKFDDQLNPDLAAVRQRQEASLVLLETEAEFWERNGL